jgi:hypothetical protein
MSEADTLPNSGGSTGIEQAAAAFERMLAPEGVNEQEDEAPQQEAEAGQAEVLEADASDETPETEEADAAETDEGADDEADADAEEGTQLELPLDALVTVKIAGKEEQVQLKEAIAGYQRQADYSRKTAELADARRAFVEEVEQVRTERAQYATLLTALEQQIAQVAPAQPDWETLKREDPLEYAIKREEFREQQEKLAAINAEKARLQALRAREEQEALYNVVEVERDKLAQALPAARDAKAWETTRKSLREYGNQLGYSDEELAQAYDHRAVVALYKAMQYDRLMNKQPKKAATIQASRTKTVVPGSTNTPPRKVSDLTRAKQRLAQTGSVKDAAAIFEKLL